MNGRKKPSWKNKNARWSILLPVLAFTASAYVVALQSPPTAFKHFIEGENKSSSPTKEQRSSVHQDHNTLTLAVLTHPNLPLPAVSVFRNMLRAFTTGRDAVTFQCIIVYYDGRQKGPKLNDFLQDFRDLQRNQVIDKLLEAQFNTSIQDAVGIRDPDFEDAPLYVTFQYLMQDCTTKFCAFFDNDIMAHEGGGLAHAVELFQKEDRALFVIPPLGMEHADFSRGKELQRKFPDADGNILYMTEVGLLPQPASSQVAEPDCRGMEYGMSTRYYVAEASRFRTALPLEPVQETMLEQHEGLQGRVFFAHCKPGSTGYLIHPPPWHMGKRLLERCGIVGLQRAVDRPGSLAVDEYNNMVEQSWSEACEKWQ